MKSSTILKAAMYVAASLVLGCSGDEPRSGDGVANTSAAATPIDLPSPAAASFSAAIDVNGTDTVSGWSSGSSGARGVSWTIAGGQAPAAPTEHLPLEGNNASAAYGISAAGDVVGESQSATTTVPVVWLGGSVTPTPLSLTGFASPAVAFDMDGTRIVGQAMSGGLVTAVVWPSPAADPVELDPLETGGTGRAYAISAPQAGESLVVGEATDNGATRGIVWVIDGAGDLRDGPDPLSPLAGDVASVAFGVDGEVIVGESQAADGSVRAVRWIRDADTANISPPLELAAGNASGVAGQTVVGHSGGQATLWNLQDLASPLVLATAPSQAIGMNALGTIVGFLGTSAFAIPAVVETPTPATGLTLVGAPSSPSAAGTSVVFTATGSGATVGGLPAPAGAYQYRFFLDSGSGWVQVQDYGIGSTYTLTTPAAGTYKVAAWVRTTDTVIADVYGSDVTHVVGTGAPTPATGLTLLAAPSSPSPTGTSVVFTATGTGSTTNGAPTPEGGYEYQFFVDSGSGWVQVQDYGIGSTYTLTTPAAGTYKVAAWVRTSAAVTADVYGDAITHVVGAATATPATGLTLFAAPSSPSASGVPVVFTATGSGSTTNGSSSPAEAYEYRFFVNDGSGWAQVQDYGVGSTYTLTRPDGTYQVAAWVRTADGVIADVFGDAVTHVIGGAPTPATGVSLTANPASPSGVGAAVVFTATGSGSTTNGSPSPAGAYQYRFFVDSGSGWAQVQDYGIGSTYTLTNPQAGPYQVAVWVRTSKGVIADVYGPGVPHVVQ